jgi:seryl-tRNA synthetase
LWPFQQAKVRVQLNEIREEQEEAVQQQDFIRAQVLLNKIKELQEELQRLSAQPDVVHEQVKIFLYSFPNSCTT